MMRNRQSGLTLVELLMAIAILSVISLAFFSVTHGTLRSWAHAEEKSGIAETGRAALERITQSILDTRHVILPFQLPVASVSSHHILCVALGLDNDGDGRVDEDSWDIYHDGEASGLPGLDDDWDGLIDEESPWDDDESGWVDEDRLDGRTNDGDSRIDEDWGADMNGDGAPGAAYVDDDGDGSIDEGASSDDDEDGSSGEDPIEPLAYYVDPEARPPQLVERHPVDGTTVLAENLYYETEDDYAAGFTVTRVQQADGTPLIAIRLILVTESGEPVEFRTSVAATNCTRRPAFAWAPQQVPH